MTQLLLSSPHVHTQFCDGKSTAADIARAAFDMGFVSLGFSGHSILSFDPVYAMSAQGEEDYIREVNRLKAEYTGRMKIWLGLEADSFSEIDRRKFEYVVASVHFTLCADGYHLPMDAQAALLADGIGKYYGGDGLAMAEAYYRGVGAYVRESMPDIIGHFDLLMKNNRDHALFDPESPRYRRAATDALDEAILGCSLLEVNTGAMARYGAKTPYPELALLEYWRAIGGRVILSSDCHHVSTLAAGYAAAQEHMRRAGFREAWLLGRGKELWEVAPLA